MDMEKYYKSISAECEALKNRVRMFINTAHWLTDGEWKETVLRNLIRRSAPQNVSIGRGFIITQDRCSTQIDLLIYDNSMPVLYKEGDLVFISPDACKAIIEVKSRVGTNKFTEAAEKLANNLKLVQDNQPSNDLFAGIFSFELENTDCQQYLNILNNVSDNDEAKIINHISLGTSIFIKYWQFDPKAINQRYDSWNLYNLTDMAQGYFIHNLLSHLSNSNQLFDDRILFPQNSKEDKLVTSLAFGQESLNESI